MADYVTDPEWAEQPRLHGRAVLVSTYELSHDAAARDLWRAWLEFQLNAHGQDQLPEESDLSGSDLMTGGWEA